jgi:hypothetical protein
MTDRLRSAECGFALVGDALQLLADLGGLRAQVAALDRVPIAATYAFAQSAAIAALESAAFVLGLVEVGLGTQRQDQQPGGGRVIKLCPPMWLGPAPLAVPANMTVPARGTTRAARDTP